jgi:hypothetical protein
VPFSHMTTRRLMFGVAAVAVFLAIVVEGVGSRRIDKRRALGDSYAEDERRLSERARLEPATSYTPYVRHLAACKEVYLRAAEHPCQPVPELPLLSQFETPAGGPGSR